MSKNSIRKRDLQAALWLVGLAYLFLTDNFWPGILVLIVLSVLIEKFYKPQGAVETRPDEFEHHPEGLKPEETIKAEKIGPQVPAQAVEAPLAWHDTSILPARCPNCGAPVVADQVHWTGAKSADCPYCNGRLS